MLNLTRIELMLAETPRECPLDDDMLAFQEVRRDVLNIEPDLFASKWFDYRHMSPFQATKVYIEQYGRIYRDVYAANIDRARAEHIHVFNIEEMIEHLSCDRGTKAGKKIRDRVKKNLTGCWRGRQVADILGMPYDHYIEKAFGFRLRFWNQPYLPQPQHLYNDLDVEKIQARWEEEQASSLFVAQHPAYLVQNYVGAAHQDDHHEWLFKQAELRSDPSYHLATFIRNDILPVEKLEYRVAPEMLAQVERDLH